MIPVTECNLACRELTALMSAAVSGPLVVAAMTGIGSRFALPNGAARSIACWLGALAGRNLELLLWVTLDSGGNCVTAAIAPNTQISRTSQRRRTVQRPMAPKIVSTCMDNEPIACRKSISASRGGAI